MNYILLGLASGALVLGLVVSVRGGSIQELVIVGTVLLVLAALGKAVYYYWIGQHNGPTINTATGFTRAGVKLLDIGHSSATFNTREFGFETRPELKLYLRLGVFVLLFLVPLGFAFVIWAEASALAAALAVLSAAVGLVVERWLFFAEAGHSVGLFHGKQRL